jgi:hypothetical protein
MSKNKNLISDQEHQDMEVQVVYQKLMDSPDDLEALADRLGITDDDILTSEQVWAEARRLWAQSSSTGGQD